MADSFLILAQAGAGSPLGTFGFLAVLVAIMYFVMIRPQQKQLKEHRALLAGLKKGDDVVTSGGILGRIHQVDDSTVTVEIASGVRVRVLKTAVSAKGTVPVAAAPTAPSADKKEDK
ncbi:preprotein translocase subunit YajC [Corallococcus praedator]|uniref:Sec translocon accessory complex subunit YajC n=1 Tax=Corallococcus praedator TaxID=2316724 RepID=A0ABX9Q931_9BACT|nr:MULTISPECIES: preprotein translocase subunit YajC [Corallococcus]RKH06122.1 preprotein translocase subunit YajC [Corallococcus sp. CA047B]RKH31294.1 preprotein translocase subunit YajC [Corallococcus sp. CA031C]RKH96013.1 preprotein translocase subunit YajC [Corallococcus praedator]